MHWHLTIYYYIVGYNLPQCTLASLHVVDILKWTRLATCMVDVVRVLVTLVASLVFDYLLFHALLFCLEISFFHDQIFDERSYHESRVTFLELAHLAAKHSIGWDLLV